MKNIEKNKKLHVSPKQLFDFFTTNAQIEQEKITNQKKVMEEQFEKATKGKNIVIANYTMADTSKLPRR